MRIYRAVAMLSVVLSVGLAALLPIGRAVAAEHFVTATPGNRFSPSFLPILSGDKVTWSNGGGFHNVSSSDDGGFRCANGCDGDGAGGSGAPATNFWQFSRVFTSVGDVDYQCDVHVGIGMTGTISVPEPSSTQLAWAALASLGLLARRRR